MQRCSSEAGVRNCPPHRPEELWLSCFARLQGETPKKKSTNATSKERAINYMLNSCPRNPWAQGVRVNHLLEGKLGNSIKRACSALALVPSVKLRRDQSVTPGVIGIVGRMKWYEALVDIASVLGMRLGRSSIGNERRSGGTSGTTYWITPVRHEAADAESAPMPLAMPCLVPRHGGGSVARHEHRAKGRLSNVVGLRRGSIGRKGRPDGGRAKGGRVI
ncbi:hypothetical protein Salat_2579000 [Sesamum alatum]|uniref:Uncharacterized protein n=1 Tax=Sesamum alatum TaxID=300844 RepID=A0AAE1XNR6_9LAMI|nr:hypothetical protein Salat_2579000 [Sesamum alatum]